MSTIFTVNGVRDPPARQAVQVDPDLVLDGAPPRLIGEFQLAPGIWNAVRGRVDDAGTKGLYLLAGSATPADEPTSHSGAGRIARVPMRTLTFFERGLASGRTSLRALFDGATPTPDPQRMGVREIVSHVEPPPALACPAGRHPEAAPGRTLPGRGRPGRDTGAAALVRDRVDGLPVRIAGGPRPAGVGAAAARRGAVLPRQQGARGRRHRRAPGRSVAGRGVRTGRGPVSTRGAAHLLALRDKLAPATAARCAGLLVVAADTPTYLRPDGVLVTSLASLGP